MTSPPPIDGSDAVVSWFGSWPAFHDHYLLSVPAPADVDGVLPIEAWVTTPNATDSAGHFLRERHCLVTFELSQIQSIETTEPTFPAIIFELTVCTDPSGCTMDWNSSYGAEGRIRARSVRVSVEPRIPESDD